MSKKPSSSDKKQIAIGDGNLQIEGDKNTVNVNQTFVQKLESSENKDGLLGFLKKLWLPTAGFLGAVTLTYNFYQLWLGDQATVTWFLAGGGLLVLVASLVWVGFSTKTTKRKASRPPFERLTETNPRFELRSRRWAWMGLGVFALLAVFGSLLLIQHRKIQEQKMIVLIASFEGPEEVYGLRNQILENLNIDFPKGGQVEIETTDEVITPEQGSERARELGKNIQADIVIWGWYRPTENPNVTFHIENLVLEQLCLCNVNESEILNPAVSLTELESFSFQQQAGQEASALISFLAGLIEYRVGNYEAALLHLDQASVVVGERLKLLDNPFEIYFYRGNTNLFLGKYQLAIQNYDRAIEFDTQDATIYNNRGAAYFKMKEFDRAVKDFGTAIAIDPVHTSSYSNRGRAYIILGEYTNSISDFDKTIEIDPQNATAYKGRGDAYANLGQYDHAIWDYDLAIQINPQDARFYYNRGLSYAYLGKLERAIQEFDRAIEINPQYADAYNNRGNVQSRLGNNKRAMQDFDKAIEINPQSADAYSNRGLVNVYLGEYKNAIQDCDKAIEINPQSADAYNNRGIAYVSLVQYERAIQDFDMAIEINPQYAEAYVNRGLSYAYFGKYEHAIRDFDKAIEINPQDAESRYNRGLVYQQIGKTIEAEADFAKYKELTGKDAP